MCHSPSDATLEELFTQRADLTCTQDTGIQVQKRAHPTRPQQQLANTTGSQPRRESWVESPLQHIKASAAALDK